MTKRLRHEMRYDGANVEQVHAMLATPDFREAVCEYQRYPERTVEITPAGGAKVFASVDGGFISVANDRVSILAEHIALGQEIDAARARADLESAQAAAGANAEFDDGVRLAQARLDAALKAS